MPETVPDVFHPRFAALLPIQDTWLTQTSPQHLTRLNPREHPLVNRTA